METLPPIEIDPRTFLREHCSLPALPTIVRKIQEIIESDDVNIKNVVEYISGDPSLVAQILKVANSAYYGLPREVSGVSFAIAFLGLNELHRMVLALAVVNTLSTDDQKDLKKFWFHSFYTASVAKHLANIYQPYLPFEELWSAAILHDIGKLVYQKFYPEHHRALCNYSRSEGCLFSEAEVHFSLPASSYIGTLLCEHWRLPDRVRSACEFHTLKDLQQLEEDHPNKNFLIIIALGNLMAQLASDNLDGEIKREIGKQSERHLGCSDSEFLGLMGEVYELRMDVERFTNQFS